VGGEQVGVPLPVPRRMEKAGAWLGEQRRAWLDELSAERVLGVVCEAPKAWPPALSRGKYVPGGPRVPTPAGRVARNVPGPSGTGRSGAPGSVRCSSVPPDACFFSLCRRGGGHESRGAGGGPDRQGEPPRLSPPCRLSQRGRALRSPLPASLSPSLLSQVNGTMVTNSSHLEVVKLIKCEYGRGAAGAPSRPR